jgi:hypothetical protein
MSCVDEGGPTGPRVLRVATEISTVSPGLNQSIEVGSRRSGHWPQTPIGATLGQAPEEVRAITLDDQQRQTNHRMFKQSVPARRFAGRSINR